MNADCIRADKIPIFRGCNNISADILFISIYVLVLLIILFHYDDAYAHLHLLYEHVCDYVQLYEYVSFHHEYVLFHEYADACVLFSNVSITIIIEPIIIIPNAT